MEDEKNDAEGHLRGLEGWQTEKLFQTTFLTSHFDNDDFCLVLGLFLLLSDDLQEH